MSLAAVPPVVLCVCVSPVNMPKYSNLETMRAKIKMALLCSTITS